MMVESEFVTERKVKLQRMNFKTKKSVRTFFFPIKGFPTFA